VAQFASLVREQIKAPITLGDREIFLTASIGIALAGDTHRRREELLKDAELAAYEAKRLGGDRIEVFSNALRSTKSDRHVIESDLRRALERGEIGHARDDAEERGVAARVRADRADGLGAVVAATLTAVDAFVDGAERAAQRPRVRGVAPEHVERETRGGALTDPREPPEERDELGDGISRRTHDRVPSG